MSRDAILSKIRTSLSGKVSAKSREAAVSARLSAHSKGVVPATRDDGKGVSDLFVRKALEAAATVETVKRTAVGKAVIQYLRGNNLPARLRLGADPRLQEIEWPRSGAPELLHGPSDGDDLAGLSHAFAAAAETGTLIMTSGPDNPTTVNFLPEHHVCIVEASDIEANYEVIWARLRRKHKGGLPRTVNMITGPSRSADIEQTLIYGAHGPVRLHILVVKD